MLLSSAIGAIADSTGASPGRIQMLARRLKDVGLLNRGTGGGQAPTATMEQVALLIIAHACAAPYCDVAKTAARIASYESEDGRTVLQWLHSMLTHCATSDDFDLQSLIVAQSVSFASGDQNAVIIRVAVNDGDPLEYIFTAPGCIWRPQHAQGPIHTVIFPGLMVWRIAQALAPNLPKIPDRLKAARANRGVAA